MGKSRSKLGKSAAGGSASIVQLNRLEAKLSKKKIELLEIKALHKKIAREFIDLWLEIRRLKRKKIG
jgi:hypothetical protein